MQMKTVEIVVKLPKESYDILKNNEDRFSGSRIYDCILKGTVLPKGYGRLIDADELIKWLELYNDRYNKRFAKTPIKDIPMYDLGMRNRNDDVISIIDRFSTIIEADKEVSE